MEAFRICNNPLNDETCAMSALHEYAGEERVSAVLPDKSSSQR